MSSEKCGPEVIYISTILQRLWQGRMCGRRRVVKEEEMENDGRMMKQNLNVGP